MALSGSDGRKAEALLAESVKQGSAILSELARQAVKRLIESDDPLAATSLFNEDERKQLADQLRDTNATAELLGRSRILLRAEQAEKFHAGKTLAFYDPSQSRDDQGRFGSGGGGGLATGKGGLGAKAKGKTKPGLKATNAMKDYTGTYFAQVNSVLRAGEVPAKGSSTKQVIDGLDKYLEQSPKRPGVSARTVRVHDPEAFAKIKDQLEKGEFSDPAYLSTSKTPSQLQINEIRNKTTPKGYVLFRVQGESGVDLTDVSQSGPAASEVLYPRGTKFKVSKWMETKAGGLVAELVEITPEKKAGEFYDPSQSRAADGKFGSGGGSASIKSPKSKTQRIDAVASKVGDGAKDIGANLQGSFSELTEKIDAGETDGASEAAYAIADAAKGKFIAQTDAANADAASSVAEEFGMKPDEVKATAAYREFEASTEAIADEVSGHIDSLVDAPGDLAVAKSRGGDDPDARAAIDGIEDRFGELSETYATKYNDAAYAFWSAFETETQEFSEGRKTQTFTDLPTDLRIFEDSPDMQPFPPQRAVDYFRRLVPGLSVDAAAFGTALEAQAFTLAITTDAVILGRVQNFLGDLLETGEGVSTAIRDLDAILDEAGVGPRKAGYAEAVVRTEMMTAYSEGSQKQLTESSELFPIWLYANPNDGRSRQSHADRDKKYYPTSATFSEVRGTSADDVINCRCVQIAIYFRDAQPIIAAGLVETSW